MYKNLKNKYLFILKIGIEPIFDAYEASVLTIELPKFKG